MKTKLITFAATVLAFAFTVHVQAQSWDWARQNTGGFVDNRSQLVATDAWGNVYALGAFNSGSIAFGAFSVTSAGLWGIYLIKYDSLGNIKWMKSFSGGLGGSVTVNSVVTDDAGNIYFTGALADPSIAFGSTTLNAVPGAGAVGAFFVKCDSNGNALWARTVGGYGAEDGIALSMDRWNHIYAAGLGYGYMIFGSDTTTSAYTYTGYVVKYDTAGTALWAKSFGSITGPGLTCMAADDSGNVIIAGYANDSLYFGSAVLPIVGAAGDNHLFFIKYDSTGHIVWTKSAGGDNYDYVGALTIDKNGYIYILGQTQSSTLSFDSISMSDPGWFFVKMNQAGHFLWDKVAYGEYIDGPNVITKDAADNIYMSGNFNSTEFIIDADSVSNSNGYAIIIKADTLGNIRWIKTGGGDSTGIGPESIAVNNFGALYVAGYDEGPELVFGDITIISPDPAYTDMFLVKLDTSYTLNVGNNIAVKNSIVVYPNPTNGVIHISFPAISCSGYLAVTDITGKEIASQELNAGNGSVAMDLSQYPCGAYIISVDCDGHKYNGKVILK